MTSEDGKTGKTAGRIHREATRSGIKWCTDVTEFRAGGQKLYLSALQDLFNNEIVAWNMSTSASQPLVYRMLHKVLKAHRHSEGLVLHSDQGWAYRTPAWRLMLEKAGIVQSMSRKGNCLDNAVMENFFSYLKVEMYYRKRYGCVKELERDRNGVQCRLSHPGTFTGHVVTE